MLAIGINHKTAPISIREQASFAQENLPEALTQVIEQTGVQEAVILSTCNRTELYSVGGDEQNLKSWLSHYHNIDQEIIQPCTYYHQGHDAIGHLMRVASGLDSLVLGEAEILGQLKHAYAIASDQGTIGKHFRRLFPAVFAVTKQVRTDTTIGTNPISIATASLSLAKRIFSDLSKRSILLIGAGKTIELVAMHYHAKGVKRMIIANRDIHKAKELAMRFHGHWIALSEVPLYLKEADIVVSATASQLPILGKGAVESAIRLRKHRPIFMVDLAVPRDIEHQVAELEDVYLYNIDDLKDIVQSNLQSREHAAEQAKAMIELQAAQFSRELQTLDAAKSIQAFRQNIEQKRQECLQQAMIKLRNGAEPAQVMQELSHQLSNKIMHEPTIRMRQAAFDGRHDIMALLKDTFAES